LIFGWSTHVERYYVNMHDNLKCDKNWKSGLKLNRHRLRLVDKITKFLISHWNILFDTFLFNYWFLLIVSTIPPYPRYKGLPRRLIVSYTRLRIGHSLLPHHSYKLNLNSPLYITPRTKHLRFRTHYFQLPFSFLLWTSTLFILFNFRLHHNRFPTST